MKSQKLYRVADEEFICKNCSKHTSLGYNILQEDAYTLLKKECVQENLCGKCLIDKRININCVVIEAVTTMIALGVLS